MIFGYILSIILIFDIFLIGLITTYFFKLKFFLEARVASGALIGIIFFGILSFIFSNILGLNAWSLIISVVIINLLPVKFLTKNIVLQYNEEWLDLKKRLKQSSWRPLFLFLVCFMIIFGYIASEMMTSENGSYFVQPVHAYGDISLHLGIISSFAFGNNFPPQSPILAGNKISYPFLIDYISAVFINPLSLGFDQAVGLTGVLMMLILIILLSYFTIRITASKLAACLVLILFFFNGGLGFFYSFNDFQAGHLNFFNFIQNLPRDYTAIKDIGFYWINVVISMLLPQRSFLFGLPVVILILYIFWDLSEQFNLPKLIIGTLLVAFLPIIHTHSLIALAPFLTWLILLMIFRNKTKLGQILFLGTVGMIIIFILSKIFLQQSDNPLSFIKFQLGWMAGKGNIFSFYAKNFGLSLIIIPAAIFFGLIKKLKIAVFALIGQIWFILPSLFIFQPWDFDNTKLFIYWYLSSVVMSAYFLSRFFLSRRLFKLFFVIIILSLLIFSGMLDVVRLFTSSGTKYEIYSPQSINLASFVKDNIKQDAIFLAVDKFDDPVVALAGRKVVLGYHSWLWTYGLDYSQREADVRTMLAGNENQDLFKKYNISYVVFFNEQTDYLLNENYFRRYELIYNRNGYRIYKI